MTLDSRLHFMYYVSLIHLLYFINILFILVIGFVLKKIETGFFYGQIWCFYMSFNEDRGSVLILIFI